MCSVLPANENDYLLSSILLYHYHDRVWCLVSFACNLQNCRTAGLQTALSSLHRLHFTVFVFFFAKAAIQKWVLLAFGWKSALRTATNFPQKPITNSFFCYSAIYGLRLTLLQSSALWFYLWNYSINGLHFVCVDLLTSKWPWRLGILQGMSESWVGMKMKWQ